MTTNRYFLAILITAAVNLAYSDNLPENLEKDNSKQAESKVDADNESFKIEKERLQQIPMVSKHTLRDVETNRWEDSLLDDTLNVTSEKSPLYEIDLTPSNPKQLPQNQRWEDSLLAE